MTVQEALKNIDVVVSSVPMKRGEHIALQQSVELVTQRCQRADELEKESKPKKEKGKK